MKKRIISLLLVLIMAFTIMPIGIVAKADTYAYSGGSGTSSDPYLISNTTDLAKQANDKVAQYRECIRANNAKIAIDDAYDDYQEGIAIANSTYTDEVEELTEQKIEYLK